MYYDHPSTHSSYSTKTEAATALAMMIETGRTAMRRATERCKNKAVSIAHRTERVVHYPEQHNPDLRRVFLVAKRCLHPLVGVLIIAAAFGVG